jgi:MFS family permease
VRQRSPLLPIFLIVLVDVMGFTIVIPLLAIYAETFGASPLVATLIVSCYAVCSLISTPIIGRLSDKHGRRPLLIISQAGTCAGFLILASSNALWMVFAGRIIDGATAGNLSLAQAYISDHTKPEDRATAFGIIGIAFGVGFMFGPWLGGQLGVYGLHVPFIAAAGMSLLSITATSVLLPKEIPPQDADGAITPAATGSEPLPRAVVTAAPGGKRPGAFDIDTYVEYFKRPRLGGLYIQFFIYTFAFSAFTSGFALFAERRLDWNQKQVGYVFAYAGLLGILLQGGLMKRLVKKFGERRLVISGFLTGIVGYLVLGTAETTAVVLLAATISSFGNGVVRPSLTSLISQAVGRHEQGVAIGISGSLSSLAMTLAPPTGGVMLDGGSSFGWTLAWTVVPATVMTLGLISTLISRKPKLPSPA